MKRRTVTILEDHGYPLISFGEPRKSRLVTAAQYLVLFLIGFGLFVAMTSVR